VDLHRFDLNLLVTLDALLTEKNVTRAGQRMHLSQSAMSGALARLRDFFQDELLVPMGRSMVMTPLAEDLVQPVGDILLQVQATIATKPRFDPATSARHFSIAVRITSRACSWSTSCERSSASRRRSRSNCGRSGNGRPRISNRESSIS
jgi:DNA-binding transcriptional LysR family regulator